MANTITYEITHEPPPGLPPEIYTNSAFWHMVFTQPVYRSLLNSILSVAPVQARTITDWENMGFVDKISQDVQGGKMITYNIFYMISDFVISVDKDMNVHVQYTRMAHQESYTVFKAKEKAWLTVALGVAGVAMTMIGIATAGSLTMALTKVMSTVGTQMFDYEKSNLSDQMLAQQLDAMHFIQESQRKGYRTVYMNTRRYMQLTPEERAAYDGFISYFYPKGAPASVVTMSSQNNLLIYGIIAGVILLLLLD